MSSPNPMDTAASDTASTLALPPSPWKRYKRYSDNRKVEARLHPQRHLMEVRESNRSEDVTCPHCHVLLSRGNGNETPDAFLPPNVFHERHKPLDDNRP